MKASTLEADFDHSERLMLRAEELMSSPQPAHEDLVVAVGLLREAWRLDHEAVLKDHRRILAMRRRAR
jgi:hypothetical protein